MSKIVCIFVLSVIALVAAEHQPLLPRPQQVTYGSGRLLLTGLEIGFASTPTAEDRFAAAELAVALAAVSGSPVPVREGAPSGRSIVLKTAGPVGALPEKDEKPGPEGRESYRIKVTEKGAEITAPSSAGLFYAVQTLRQMAEGRGAEAGLPEADVHDWPSLSYRGFMMDLGHGSIMKEEEIRRQIDLLSRFKANQYYFYSEGAIELKGYPLLNRKGRYSQVQVRRIIEYARARHVDVVPCVEYYGHLHDLFRIERYADMAALSHGGDLNPLHPKAEAMLKDWIAQTAALFPSPWFHVGLDEPFELEAAGSKAAGGIEPAELYRRHLDKVTELVRAQGKRVLFWADIDAGARIFNKYPDLAEKLPADVVPVPWYYAAKPDYTKWVEPFGKAHKPQVVAPGITCWNDIYPDYQSTFTNIEGFLAAGRKAGAIGVINTGWTDDAQTLYRLAQPGMAYGAAASWQTEPVDRSTFFALYSGLMYSGDVARETAAALTALSESRDLLAEAVGGRTMHAFWEDALEPGRLEQATAHRDQLRNSRLRAEDAIEHLDRALELAPGDLTLPTLRLAAEMLDYLGMKRLYAVDIADYFRSAGPKPGSKEIWLYLELETTFQDHGHASDLMDAITSLRQDYEQAWKQEWTDYRFGTAIGRWDAEYEYWRTFQAKLQDVTGRFKEGDTMPPLEAFRPKK
jgi:hexosaminidase